MLPLAQTRTHAAAYDVCLCWNRKGLELDPSSTELQEAAQAAEMLLKQTSKEKYSNHSSKC